MREMPPSPLVVERGKRAGRWLSIAVALGAVAVGFRGRLAPAAPPGIVVEVEGDVDRPGFYAVDPPTLARALEIAGPGSGSRAAVPGADRILEPGDLVAVSGGDVAVRRPSQPLLFGLPVDVNEASEAQIAAIPGVGDSAAQAIAAARPYWTVDDLARARGVGPALLEAMRPYVTTGLAGPRPLPRKIDLNRASEAELERLPGIGPAIAGRIVRDRQAHGSYRSVGDLDRVPGVGPAMVRRLLATARVGAGEGP